MDRKELAARIFALRMRDYTPHPDAVKQAAREAVATANVFFAELELMEARVEGRA